MLIQKKKYYLGEEKINSTDLPNIIDLVLGDLTTHIFIPKRSFLTQRKILGISKEGMTGIFSKNVAAQFVRLKK